VRREPGQAAVELVAAAPIVVAAALLLAQVLLAAQAQLRAERAAARAATAAMQDADPAAAARAGLPADARVSVADGRVHVELAVPALLPVLRGALPAVSASAGLAP
jgi:hypothetical protein